MSRVARLAGSARSVSVGLALALAACGGSAPEVAPATPAPATAPVVSEAPSAAAPVSAAAPAPAGPRRVESPLLETHYTPEALTAACAQAETDTDAKLAKLVATPVAELTFDTSFGAFEAITAEYVETASRLEFMKDIHLDGKVRDAASACEERSGKYLVTLSARKDLFDAMRGYQNAQGKAATLDVQQKRLIELTMRDFHRSGLDLAEKDRAELVKLRARLSELESKFGQNLGEDKSSIEVTAAELDGMPADFIARLGKSKDGKKLVLTTKYPDFYPVMENAKSEPLRRKLLHAFNNRAAAANTKLLNEALQLRAQAAKLLGFKTHLDFATEPKMAHDGKTVQAFLDRMQTGLKPGLKTLVDKMTELKRTETKDKKAVINAWDWRFYMNGLRKRDYALDDEAVRAYLPAPKVMAGMFSVYERIFGVRFVEVQNPTVWTDGVKLYEMRDGQTNELLARFYTDMYPREGKYGHAAEFNMAPGHAVADGYRIPLSVLVVNFEPPSGGKVAHLSMEEVDTLFHEFGHVMHESLTEARYPSLAGSSVARDFVEAPSQMLENWAYQPDVLALVSEDPTDATKPMPRDLMEKIAHARHFDAGVAYSRQVFLGKFDTAIHTQDKPDADAIARQLSHDITGFPEDKDTHFAATFGHMMGGYDGGYYGYLWSEVFSTDMFTRFQKEGIFNPQTGRDYREKVLARGRIEDADVLLRDFLGREPNEVAFLASVGITPSKADHAAPAAPAPASK